MANVSHASLTGSSLHEPKGVASAAAGLVYVSDGAGSGSWTDPNTVITATNFTTGDCKLTWKTTADSSWVMMDDGTIGDALSAATTRANADCEDLFTLFWEKISNTYAAVSGGRGANAAADWAAHKTIALPKALGRAFLMSGSGSGLTSHSLGETGGAETRTISISNMPAHDHGGTTGSGGSHSHSVDDDTGQTSNSHTHARDFQAFSGASLAGGGVSVVLLGTSAGANTTSNQVTDGPNADHTHPFSDTTSTDGAHTHSVASQGSGSAFSIQDPFTAINIMIKL